MTDLVFWTALSGLLVALAWLLYIADRILVWGLWPALAGRPEDQPQQSEWARRHKRAHTVAVEAFVVWGALAAKRMAPGSNGGRKVATSAGSGRFTGSRVKDR